MEAGRSAANGVESPVQKKWIAYIEEEIAEEDDDLFTFLANSIKDLLLSKSETAARDTAVAIDTYYEEEYFASDSLLRFEEDKGMTGFLLDLWEIVFPLAKVVSYKDDAQIKLVNLILELQKLPTRTHKIYKKDYLVYVQDPIFPMRMDDHWNGAYPGDDDGQQQNPDQASSQDLEQRCNDWINLSSFYARLSANGVMDRFSDPYRYASYDIRKGLEQTNINLDLSNDVRRNCKLLVSANWILIAGDVLYGYYLEESKRSKNWGVDKWPIWKEKLREITSRMDCSSEVRAAASEALSTMIEVQKDVS